MVRIENFQRVFDLVPSDAYGILFCQGCVAEMGENVLEAIRSAMEAYRDVGFDGPIMMDHTPGVPSDPSGMASRSYSNGYIKALIQAVSR